MCGQVRRNRGYFVLETRLSAAKWDGTVQDSAGQCSVLCPGRVAER